jgi:hypothetical protein
VRIVKTGILGIRVPMIILLLARVIWVEYHLARMLIVGIRTKRAWMKWCVRWIAVVLTTDIVGRMRMLLSRLERWV